MGEFGSPPDAALTPRPPAWCGVLSDRHLLGGLCAPVGRHLGSCLRGLLRVSAGRPECRRHGGAAARHWLHRPGRAHALHLWRHR
eukprot:5739707-Prymnesium_polylepis.1